MALRHLAPICTVGLLSFSGPALSETGAEAFARRDFAAARTLWLEEIRSGEPRAALGLGALYDLGLGVARDPERAFRYYLTAADSGLAEAQFNVAVMLDSGAVRGGTPGAAAVWYGRAAANGYARAEYNLGTMFESGDGVDRNADLARVWLARAGEEISAANDRLEGLGPAIGLSFEPPLAMGGFRTGSRASARAELVWTAPPAMGASGFLVQLADLSADSTSADRIVPGIETDASALAAPLPDSDRRYAWRVVRIDRDRRRYAASPWLLLDAEEPGERLPAGSVAFRIAPGDDDARRLASDLRRSLDAAGIWSRIETADEVPDRSTVAYTFEDDRVLAREIADFLPVLDPDDLRISEFIGADPRPGEITVTLAGGLSSG